MNGLRIAACSCNVAKHLYSCTLRRLTRPFLQALVAAQQRNFELEGLLDEAQTKIGCAAKHRKSAQQQLDAQEQDFEKLGQRLKVSSFCLPRSAFQPCFMATPSFTTLLTLPKDNLAYFRSPWL